MKTDNSTIRDKALDWFWNKNTYGERNHIANKYFQNKNRSLYDEEIESCYLSEHPAETIKEVDNLSNGEWKLEWENDTGINDDAYWEWYNLINPDGENVAKIPDQKDANKIVKALNNFDDMYRALKRLFS